MKKKNVGDKVLLDIAQKVVNEVPEHLKEQLSDGYHTFKELYEFRKLYNAAFFNLLATTAVVEKSYKHYDGEYCFGRDGDWFIVVAYLPTGQLSNHYPKEDWNLFKCKVLEKVSKPFDGHTPKDVAERLKNYVTLYFFNKRRNK